MNFRKVNNITGWVIFFVAFATYFLTREARGSLWDCGEFVATAKNMGLPHPPGAPLFILLGRFFIILFGDDARSAASAVNFMSALASAATILFLFWSVTHFARKMFVSVGEALDNNQIFTVMASGVVGALAYAFSDSFWFSAVEGEVYALSSFFTALVFWAMLKWEHADEHAGADVVARARADRWIIFLFFMMGLSIGVHLLNLLTIPAIVMIYYYRRYNASTWGAIAAFVISCIITGLVQVGAIQYSMKAAGMFDVFFVNSFGMPFFSGFAIYFILLAALIVWALRFTEKNISKATLTIWFSLFFALSALPFIVSLGSDGAKILKFLFIAAIGVAVGYFLRPGALRILKLSLWCYAFIMLGYFMYFTTMIRSNANPAIDMNNVDNPINLVYYLSREQYGEAPLVYGPHFVAEVKRYPRDHERAGYAVIKEGEMRYVKGKDKYIEIGRQREYEYDGKDKQLFPRIWDSSNDQYHFDTYIDWLDLGVVEAREYSIVTNVDPDTRIVTTQNQAGKTENYSIDDDYSIRVNRGQMVYRGDKIAVKAPTYADNMEWFLSYQNGFMYWRYFMWNFAGKQNDIQASGNRRDGNFITGLPFIDNPRLGDQSKMPDSLKNNKANNKLFLLPFVLGILGCVYHFLKNRKDWVVTFLLFFLTGVAVVIYLNQPGNQPRERDYAYVGSFYAFAIWIGLSVVAMVRLAREKADKISFQNTILYGSILTLVIMFMSVAYEDLSSGFMASVVSTLYYAVVASVLVLLVRAISGGGTNAKVLNISAAAIAFIAAPLIMAQQEWDDHDRSEKTLAPALAKDYLESCAPNAIIFTFGDNDTYPLWYAQEVEGVRPDIRIINNSLLGIDWYINQLRYRINSADSVDVIWTPEQIEGHNREYMYYEPNQRVDQQTFYPLYEVMKSVLGEVKRDDETGRDVGLNSYPVKRFKVAVDTALVRTNGTVTATDSVLSEIRFEVPKNAMARNDLMILNIIAANNWKRPIYFTSPYGELGFGDYLRKDGLAYRLVPAKPSYPQNNWVTNLAMREEGLGSTQIRDNNIDTLFRNLNERFEFGGAEKNNVYFDEENRRHLLSLRAVYGEGAGNLADAGKTDQALKLLEKAAKNLNPASFPYAMVSRYNSHNQTGILFLEAAYKAGNNDLAERVRKDLRKDLEQQMTYYGALNKMSGPEFTKFMQQYDSMIENARTQQDVIQAEYMLNDALNNKQRTLRTEIIIAFKLGKVIDAVERKYAPQVAKPVEGQQTIQNPARPDSAGAKPDTANK